MKLDGFMLEQMIHRLLEAARIECGEPPNGKFTRSSRVIGRAMETAGELLWLDHHSLENQSDSCESTPAVERYYDVLVRLVFGIGNDRPLLEGEGNFGAYCLGHPKYPPAHSSHTTCRITSEGVEYLRNPWSGYSADWEPRYAWHRDPATETCTRIDCLEPSRAQAIHSHLVANGVPCNVEGETAVVFVGSANFIEVLRACAPFLGPRLRSN